jgi:hypothetical protein
VLILRRRTGPWTLSQSAAPWLGVHKINLEDGTISLPRTQIFGIQGYVRFMTTTSCKPQIETMVFNC